MKFKTDFPPVDNEVQFNERVLVAELNKVQAEMDEYGGAWNEDAYKHYLEAVKNIDFGSENVSKETRELNAKVLRSILKLAEDPGLSYGCWLDSDISEIIKKTVDLKDKDRFYDSLETLYEVEDFYANFVSDEFKPEEKKYPIQELIDNLNKKAEEKESNLFLSSYIKTIKETGPSPYFFFGFGGQEFFGDHVVYIGENRFANISSVSTLDFKLKISKKDDYILIKSLFNQKKELEGKLKSDENNDSSKEKIKMELRKISKKLEKLVTEENVQENFRKVKSSSQNDVLDERLFGMIWATESLREGIEEKIGVRFDRFDIPEQAQIISFLKSLSNEKSEDIKNFSERYGHSGFRTFLSVEQGGKEMGDKILALGEKLEPKIAEQIFRGYSHLIDSAEGVKSILSKTFEKEEDQILKKAPEQVYEALLLRAKDVLIGAHKIARDDESKLNPDDVIKALEGITLMLDILSDIEKRESFNFTKFKKTDENLFKFNIRDKDEKTYDLKIFVRGVAEVNAQARINFELSFDTDNPNEELQKAFYNEVNFVEKGKIVKGSKLRIGIDRDTYGDETLVSLDLGRSEHTGNKFERTGDVLGKLLVKATESNIGHHTTSFDKGLADEKVFQKLCTDFINYLNKA